MDSSTKASLCNVKDEIEDESKSEIEDQNNPKAEDQNDKSSASQILNEDSPPPNPNVYIDIDGKWKLELNDNGLGDESIVDGSTGETEEAIKWCTPVSVMTDDSSSEDEKIKFCKPVHSDGHKFSDGIVWETIEECDEDESGTENDLVHKHEEERMNELTEEVKREVRENNLGPNSMSQNMNKVSNESHFMSNNNTQGKKELQQSHQAVTSLRSPSMKPERDFEPVSCKVGKSLVGSVSRRKMDMPSSMSDEFYETLDNCEIQDEKSAKSLNINFADNYSLPSPLQSDMSCIEDLTGGQPSQFPQEKEERIEDDNSASPDNDTFFEKIKECQISKEEIGNISVKNMAKFWEEVSKKVKDETLKTEHKIQKKWNSMPDLKDRYEKRKLPMRPTQEKIDNIEDVVTMPESAISSRQIVKSDEIIDDVDLCRSVSIRDRKQMFEMMAKQAQKQKKKQWSSMPSLKQERQLPQTRHPSPEKVKVRWEDEYASEDEEECLHEEPRLQTRGKSPIREIMKAFEVNKTRQTTVSLSKPNEISNRYSHSRLKSPVSPLLHTNEVFNYRDDFHSSSESVSSSLTSASTVVPRSPGIPSMLEDSGGEIYTDGTNKTHDEQGLFVVENGTEFSLTPVNKRKSMFEIHKKNGRVRKISRDTKKQNRIIEPPMEAPVDTVDTTKEYENQSLERIKSSNIPYIEEEKDILENIRMVQSLKMKFLK